MIARSKIMFHKSQVRYMCTPRRLPVCLKSWPGISSSRQITKPKTGVACLQATPVVKDNNDIKNDKIYTDKWMEGVLPEVKSEK